MHAAKECKATSVLSKFKEMEKRVANGEDIEDDARKCSCIKNRSRWISSYFVSPLFEDSKKMLSICLNSTTHSTTRKLLKEEFKIESDDLDDVSHCADTSNSNRVYWVFMANLS